MPLVDNPNETIVRDADAARTAATDLTGAPVARVERRQVTDVTAPPPPWVTEYQIITRACPCCAAPRPGPSPRAWRPAPSTGPGCSPGRRSCCAGTTYPSAAPPR